MAMVFLDLESANDRGVLWEVLKKRGVPVAYVKVSQDIYKKDGTCVKSMCGETGFHRILP